MSDMDENQSKRHGPERVPNISDLPIDVIKHCLAFVGPGNYRFVAGACHRFREQYSFPKKTTWKTAAVSSSCVDFSIVDDALLPQPFGKEKVLRILQTKAACSGNEKVLQFILDKYDCLPDEETFSEAAKHGHLSVFQWAEKEKLVWWGYFSSASHLAARRGYVNILAWIYEHFPCGVHFDGMTSGNAFVGGHIAVLEWLYDNELLDLGRI